MVSKYGYTAEPCATCSALDVPLKKVRHFNYNTLLCLGCMDDWHEVFIALDGASRDVPSSKVLDAFDAFVSARKEASERSGVVRRGSPTGDSWEPVKGNLGGGGRN